MLALHPFPPPPPPVAESTHRSIATPEAPIRCRPPVTARLASLAIPPPALTVPDSRPISTMNSFINTPASSSRTPATTNPATASFKPAMTTVAATAAAPAPTPQPDPHIPVSPPSSTASSSSEPTPTPITPNATHEPAPFDIHSYPSTELLRLLASLLTQIASTNDKITPSPSPASPSSQEQHGPIWSTLMTASRISLANPTSALTFHARNIPTISLESYLLRILKYCPTTNEVFLSLLVYFDRMSKLAGDATGRTFVIDSYNVHRLVIAGVTVASKFFSDVFYTNSRYAKVGGLPQAELNQLELQFLLLNDFSLVISQEEMQRYAEQLIVFSEGSLPPPSPSPSPAPALAVPQPTSVKTNGAMHAMGAIDAYGGAVASSASGALTPSARAYAPAPHPPAASTSTSASAYTASSTTARSPVDEDDAASEAGTETETETEGGWTTDDEPTIRPGGGADRSDCASLCSTRTDEGDREGDGFFAGDEGDGDLETGDSEARVGGEVQEHEKEGGSGTPGRGGERTPEQRRVHQEGGASKEADFAMASP